MLISSEQCIFFGSKTVIIDTLKGFSTNEVL